MPTTTLTPTPYQTVLDTNGNPLPGALIYTYAAGTTTPATTYTDSTGTVANTNPIVADSAGRWVAYLEAGQSYKFVIKTSGGVTVETQDNILGTFATNASTVTVTGTTAATLNAGDLVCLRTTAPGTPGYWITTSNTSPNTSTIPIIGVALNNTTPGGFAGTAAVTVALSNYTITTTGLTAGAIYYLGADGGSGSRWTSTPPSTNVRVIGQALSSTKLLFNPKQATNVLGLSSSLNVGNQATTGTTGSLVVTTDGAGVNKIESGTNLTAATAAPLAFTNMGAGTEWARFASDGTLLVGTTSTTANGGVLQVSNGLTFPSVHVACTNVNTLDDYKEGTWTPTVIGATSGAVTSYSYQIGYYTKIGNLVIAPFTVAVSAKGTSIVGAITIGGLPYTSGNANANDRWVNFVSWANTTTAYISMVTKVANNSSVATIEAITAASTSLAGSSIALANIADTTVFQGVLCYQTTT